MDFVRRFPHPSSILADVCKYGCLVSFLHRIMRCDMRTKDFIAHAATRMTEMCTDGYDAARLLLKLRSFMSSYHRPAYRWQAVCAQVRARFEAAMQGAQRSHHQDPFPDGTEMAHVQRGPAAA